MAMRRQFCFECTIVRQKVRQELGASTHPCPIKSSALTTVEYISSVLVLWLLRNGFEQPVGLGRQTASISARDNAVMGISRSRALPEAPERRDSDSRREKEAA